MHLLYGFFLLSQISMNFLSKWYFISFYLDINLCLTGTFTNFAASPREATFWQLIGWPWYSLTNHKAAVGAPASSLVWRKTEEESHVCTADSLFDGDNIVWPSSVDTGLLAGLPWSLLPSCEQLGSGLPPDGSVGVGQTADEGSDALNWTVAFSSLETLNWD